MARRSRLPWSWRGRQGITKCALSGNFAAVAKPQLPWLALIHWCSFDKTLPQWSHLSSKLWYLSYALFQSIISLCTISSRAAISINSLKLLNWNKSTKPFMKGFLWVCSYFIFSFHPILIILTHVMLQTLPPNPSNLAPCCVTNLPTQY